LIKIPESCLLVISPKYRDEKAFEYCKENNIDPQCVQGYPYIFGKFIE